MAKGALAPDCPEWWDDEQDSKQERRQREAVLDGLVTEDCNGPPTLEMAQQWHTRMFTGVAPHTDYPGNFRHMDKKGPPCLYGVQVLVDDAPGCPPDKLSEALEKFIKQLQERISTFDTLWKKKRGSPRSEEIFQLLKLAAWAHGEWVRLHPFINGNGRTSRLWGNYVFCRYGFAPIEIRPRPGGAYGEAARNSMRRGEHSLMERVYANLLKAQLESKL